MLPIAINTRMRQVAKRHHWLHLTARLLKRFFGIQSWDGMRSKVRDYYYVEVRGQNPNLWGHFWFLFTLEKRNWNYETRYRYISMQPIVANRNHYVADELSSSCYYFSPGYYCRTCMKRFLDVQLFDGVCIMDSTQVSKLDLQNAAYYIIIKSGIMMVMSLDNLILHIPLTRCSSMLHL